MARKNTAVSVAEAKQNLSELLGRVAFGRETVTISKRGRPMAKVVPVDAPDSGPRLGDVEGWLREDDSFFDEIEERVASRAKHAPRAYKDARKRKGKGR
jgi:prevent-host-death family protein